MRRLGPLADCVERIAPALFVGGAWFQWFAGEPLRAGVLIILAVVFAGLPPSRWLR